MTPPAAARSSHQGIAGEISVQRGARFLRRFLREQSADVRMMDVAAFRDWLAERLPRWRHDPVVQLQSAIRDLRRVHPRLIELEQQSEAAQSAYEASPNHARLEQIEQELADAGKAIAGLIQTLDNAAADKRSQLSVKLRHFEDLQERLRRERQELQHATRSRGQRDRASAELAEYCQRIGLARLESQLKDAQQTRGQSSGGRGASFEEIAQAATDRHLLPRLARNTADGTKRLDVLTGVTLAAADVEIDQMIVRRARSESSPVVVLAIVEAKRNVNDIAHGFRQRQANLAWLTGDRAAYRALDQRTKQYPTGNFDRPFVHEQGGKSFTIGPTSFRLFRRDKATGYFLDRLYLITRARPLDGLSAAALSRLRHRAATDTEFDLDDEIYLEKLLRWTKRQAEPLEARDVLALFAEKAKRAGNVLFV